MNGFTNSFLSMLLSWLKALVSDLWQLFDGEQGGAMLRWLAENWKALVLIICIAGFVLDRVIYFIRWRPDYLWRSRRARRKKADEAPPADEPVYDAPVYDDTPAYDDAPPAQPAPLPPEPVYDTTLYQRPAPQQQATRVYQAVQPPMDAPEVDPVFDDEPIDWEAPPAPSDFGVSKPEPLTYMRDVQAGFAPPQTPQQIYGVHPGLDDQALRQNFGLDQQGEPAPMMHVPTWQPFPQQQQAKAPGAFTRFAQKARSLVSMADEDSAPSIRDLRPPVDRSQAFHKPVFPRSRNWQDGDDDE